MVSPSKQSKNISDGAYTTSSSMSQAFNLNKEFSDSLQMLMRKKKTSKAASNVSSRKEKIKDIRKQIDNFTQVK